MAKLAGLYLVQGPNGTYYAVFDPESGRLWTERSEHSARAQARDAGFDLAPERAITHKGLMKLSGRDTAPGRSASATKSATSPAHSAPVEKPLRPLISRAPFAASEPGGPVLTSSSSPIGGALFSADNPVKPPANNSSHESETPSAGDIFTRDVLDEKHPFPCGKGKNPFADRKPRQKD